MDDNKIPDESIQGALVGDMGDPANQAPANDQNNDWGHPGTPIGNPAPAPADSLLVDATPAPMPELTQSDAPSPQITSAPTGGDPLTDLKQQAISDLSPLLQHLDQTPEDKFRTTMMMIQATDDQSLLAAAHSAAMAITDEKSKAQALLDVINEVNYFSQHPQHEK